MAATLNQLKSRRLCAARCSRSRNGRMDARTGRAGKVERETACMLYTHTISTRYGTHRQTQHTQLCLLTHQHWNIGGIESVFMHGCLPISVQMDEFYVFIRYLSNISRYTIFIYCYGSVINKCRTKISNWNVFNRFGILFLSKTFKIKILG